MKDIEIENLELLSKVLGVEVERYRDLDCDSIVIFPSVERFSKYELTHLYKVYITQKGIFEITVTQKDETLVKTSIYDCCKNKTIHSIRERGVSELQQVIKCCEKVVEV